jgi:hypothetical protein
MKGHWTDDRYVPEPSVQMFEKFLGAILAQRPCDHCRQPLGSEPRKMIDKKQYHPQCWAQWRG